MTLPKFLLAWSDFNWFWLYARLRPAPAGRWTPLRTLSLVGLSAGLGAAVGLALALAFFRQPVGWLPWLLGLWGGCLALCWFGVTALCWNQRAARLAVDAATPLKLPPSRFRFGRWCLGFVYLALLGILTPFALLVTVENLRGELAWKRERARLVAAGEKLTFREILGPEIPPEQNAGAANVFAPLFDYEGKSQTLATAEMEGNARWRQSNLVARLEAAFNTPANFLPETSTASSKGPRTPLIVMTDWSAAYRAAVAASAPEGAVWASQVPLPPPGDPARDVLAGLAAAEPELAEVCAAASLPRAQFPARYDEGFDCLLRHLATLKGAQRVLQLRCAAHLAAHDVTAAFSDATNALNIAELLREEPLLISQLVRYAQWHIAVSTLWQGLVQHGWSDAELQVLQQRLARTDLLPGLVAAFEGERAGGMLSMERLIQDPRFYSGVMEQDYEARQILRAIPRGMLRQNQVAMAYYGSAMLAGLRRGITNSSQSGLTILLHSDEAKLERLVPTAYSPFRVMVAMVAPATSKAINRTASAQTTIQLAATACALERYRLAHGEFPEKLEQLVPQFCATVPLDPMVNQPFKYQRTDDGWFLLYSVGPNGKDDGGVMRADDQKKDSEDLDWPWPVPTRPSKVRLF